VVGQIRQLTINEDDAKSRLLGILASMRALLTAAARQALLAGRALLAAALTAIEEALVKIGSKLTTPVIFINFPPRISPTA
jgi:hypothetical protein